MFPQRLLFVICVGLFAPPVLAQPVYTGWFSDTAIKGYDPVAYFTQGRAVKGSDAHSFRWRDAEWHFSSAEHRDAFAAAPDRYAPQYGGYCAYAVAEKGDLVKVDPTAWSIVEDRLYLNYSQDIQTRWENRQADYIRQGRRNWNKILTDQ